MPIWLCSGTIPVPHDGDRVIIKRGHEAHGQAGVILSTKEGQVFSYDCEYLHTVKLDNGETVHVNDLQVRFETRPKRPERNR